MGNFSTCSSVFKPKCLVRHKHPSTVIEELCHRFSFAQLQKSTNNFHKSMRLLHFGWNCHVLGLYKGCINIGGTDHTIMIKYFSKQYPYDKQRSKEWLSELKNEIQLLCQLHHPNLASLIGFCDEKKELMVVYKYTANGSLYDHLRCDMEGYKSLPWKKRLKICIGVARGLHYLHAGAKHTIYHRDIRSCNILLDENWVPKLANFEISLRGPSSMSKVKPTQLDVIRGKVGLMAPEYAVFGTLTDKCDVYLFGLILLELVCGREANNTLTEIIIMNDTKVKQNRAMGKHREDENDLVYFYNLATLVRDYVEKGNAHKVIDPYIFGKIAPRCWEIYMGIAESCMLRDANEHPTMGEVQLELEHMLEIQEEADSLLPSH